MTDNIEQETASVAGVRLAEAKEETFGDYMRGWWLRVRAGDLGSLPIVAGLILIALVFGVLEPLFFSPRNFVNLLLQMAGMTTIAIGVVYVLLIAEIDLSIGFVGAVGAIVMTLLLRESGPAWPWALAIAAGLFVTIIIGLLQGFITTRAGVPSFVVTLAGLLMWSGVVLILTTELSTAGVIVIQNKYVLGIANAFLPPLWGWVLFSIAVGGYAMSQFVRRRRLQRQNLSVKPTAVLVFQIVGLALIMGIAVGYANQDRGMPVVTVIMLLFLLFW